VSVVVSVRHVMVSVCRGQRLSWSAFVVVRVRQRQGWAVVLMAHYTALALCVRVYGMGVRGVCVWTQPALRSLAAALSVAVLTADHTALLLCGSQP
jgi:hypothetical protein